MQFLSSIAKVWILWMTIGLLAVLCHWAKAADCKDAATTAAMRACENDRYQQSEQAMQAAYAEAMKRLDPVQKGKLRQAQRAWVAFRDANANFLASAADSGNLTYLIRISTFADMTEARTKELQKLQKQ